MSLSKVEFGEEVIKDEKSLERIYEVFIKSEEFSYPKILASIIKEKGGPSKYCIHQLKNEYLLKIDPSKNLNKSIIIKNVHYFILFICLIPFFIDEKQIFFLDQLLLLFDDSLNFVDSFCSPIYNFVSVLMDFVKNSSKYELSFNCVSKFIHFIGIFAAFRISNKDFLTLLSFATQKKQKIKEDQKPQKDELKEEKNDIQNEKSINFDAKSINLDEEVELNEDYAPLIIDELIKMSRKNYPNTFYNFTSQYNAPLESKGIPSSSETDTGISCFCADGTENSKDVYFPSNGFSVMTWMRIEQNSPRSRILAFMDTKGVSFEVFFERNKLKIQLCTPNNSSSNFKVSTKTHQFSHSFVTGRWFHICLVYSIEKMLLGIYQRGSFQLYVNSKLISSTTNEKNKSNENVENTVGFDLPGFSKLIFFNLFTGKPFPKYSHSQNYQISNISGPFVGQTSAIVIMKIPLSSSIISNQFSLGPDYCGMFSSRSLHSSMFRFYHPRTLMSSNSFIEDVSNSQSISGCVYDAKLLQGSSILVSRPLRDSIYSVGGVEVLFPLLAALQMESLQSGWAVDFSICSKVVSLIEQLLSNPVARREAAQKHSISVLGGLLEGIGGPHVGMNTIKSVKSLCEALIKFCSTENDRKRSHDFFESEEETIDDFFDNDYENKVDDETKKKERKELRKFSSISECLLNDFFVHILLNFRIWGSNSFEVQSEVLQFSLLQIAQIPSRYSISLFSADSKYSDLSSFLLPFSFHIFFNVLNSFFRPNYEVLTDYKENMEIKNEKNEKNEKEEEKIEKNKVEKKEDSILKEEKENEGKEDEEVPSYQSKLTESEKATLRALIYDMINMVLKHVVTLMDTSYAKSLSSSSSNYSKEIKEAETILTEYYMMCLKECLICVKDGDYSTSTEILKFLFEFFFLHKSIEVVNKVLLQDVHIKSLLSILEFPNYECRLSALKMISLTVLCVNNLPFFFSNSLYVTSDHLFESLSSYLRMYPLDKSEYVVLFQIMLGEVSQIVPSVLTMQEKPRKIIFSRILRCFFDVFGDIGMAEKNPKILELSEVFIKDLSVSLNGNKENRISFVCVIPSWPNLILSLLIPHSKSVRFSGVFSTILEVITTLLFDLLPSSKSQLNQIIASFTNSLSSSLSFSSVTSSPAFSDDFSFSSRSFEVVCALLSLSDFSNSQTLSPQNVLHDFWKLLSIKLGKRMLKEDLSSDNPFWPQAFKCLTLFRHYILFGSRVLSPNESPSPISVLPTNHNEIFKIEQNKDFLQERIDLGSLFLETISLLFKLMEKNDSKINKWIHTKMEKKMILDDFKSKLYNFINKNDQISIEDPFYPSFFVLFFQISSFLLEKTNKKEIFEKFNLLLSPFLAEPPQQTLTFSKNNNNNNNNNNSNPNEGFSFKLEKLDDKIYFVFGALFYYMEEKNESFYEICKIFLKKYLKSLVYTSLINDKGSSLKIPEKFDENFEKKIDNLEIFKCKSDNFLFLFDRDIKKRVRIPEIEEITKNLENEKSEAIKRFSSLFFNLILSKKAKKSSKKNQISVLRSHSNKIVEKERSLLYFRFKTFTKMRKKLERKFEKRLKYMQKNILRTDKNVLEKKYCLNFEENSRRQRRKMKIKSKKDKYLDFNLNKKSYFNSINLQNKKALQIANNTNNVISKKEEHQPEFQFDLNKLDRKKVVFECACEIVVPFNQIEGRFILSNNSILLLDVKKMIHNKIIRLDDIKYIFLRRFLFVWNSMEIFFEFFDEKKYSHTFTKRRKKHKSPIYVKFSDENELENVIENLRSVRKHKKEKERFKILGLKNQQKMLNGFTTKWQYNEISNFDYLMILNTFGSRSFNDLSQYPIFPYILTDFHSDSIDFSKDEVFRDLSKPIGSLDKEKFALIQNRFRDSFNFANFSKKKQKSDHNSINSENNENYSFYQRFNELMIDFRSDSDIPPFQYGSHYSSISVPLFYMIRVQPFSSFNVTLQGGHFDIPDRLFHSIRECFNNTQTQLSDVKELIPEFYYFCDFLRNSSQNIQFGMRQDNVAIGDVVLPKWSKSAEDFIRKNSLALESPYVSKHLNEWIDLIFGYKNDPLNSISNNKNNNDCLSANNLFYYLTYESFVKKEYQKINQNPNKKDALSKLNSIHVQVSNFGQTPPTLFNKPHPHRKIIPQLNLPSPQNIIFNSNNNNNNNNLLPETPITPIIVFNIFSDNSNSNNSNNNSNDFSEKLPFVMALLCRNFISNNNFSFLCVDSFRKIAKIEVNIPKKSVFVSWNGYNNNSNSNNSSLIPPFASDFSNSTSSLKISSKLIAMSSFNRIMFFGGFFDRNQSILSFKIHNNKKRNGVFADKIGVEDCSDIVTCLSLSENDNYLVCGCLSGVVRVFNVIYKKKREIFDEKIDQFYFENEEDINNNLLNFNDDNIEDSSYFLNNNHILCEKNIIFGHFGSVSSVECDENNDIIVSCDSKCVRLSDLSSGKPFREIYPELECSSKLGFGIIDSVSIKRDDSSIIIFSKVSNMIAHFSLNGTLIQCISLASPINCVLVSPFSCRFLFCGGDACLLVYDLTDLSSFFFNVPFDSSKHTPVTSLSLISDNLVACGHKKGYISIYSLETTLEFSKKETLKI